MCVRCQRVLGDFDLLQMRLTVRYFAVHAQNQVDVSLERTRQSQVGTCRISGVSARCQPTSDATYQLDWRLPRQQPV